MSPVDPVLVFTADGCPHCRAVIEDFNARNVRFREINLSREPGRDGAAAKPVSGAPPAGGRRPREGLHRIPGRVLDLRRARARIAASCAASGVILSRSEHRPDITAVRRHRRGVSRGGSGPGDEPRQDPRLHPRRLGGSGSARSRCPGAHRAPGLSLLRTARRPRPRSRVGQDRAHGQRSPRRGGELRRR